MSDTLGIMAGVAGRYASALFELTEAEGASDQVRGELAALGGALGASDDLSRALTDPSITREAMASAIDAVAEKTGAGRITRNFVKLMASKRRLGALPRAIRAFDALIAEKRGEETVDVTSASELSDAQRSTLQTAVENATGKKVKMNVSVDPDLIGGLVLKLGSRMIDASLRTKLAVLQQRMKEVG